MCFCNMCNNSGFLNGKTEFILHLSIQPSSVFMVVEI